MHTKEKPFKCRGANCDKRFADQSTRYGHEKTHTGKRKHVCPEEGCNFKSATASSLKDHILTHIGVRAFACVQPGCGTACLTQSQLNMHTRSVHERQSLHICEHCGSGFTRVESLRRHCELHERQANYKFGCQMQDCGTQVCETGDVPCSIRTETERQMEYHIQRNHTIEGIGAKLQSEAKLAQFFDVNDVLFDRDWTNRISFKGCKNIQGTAFSARPDFFLPVESARLNAVVLVGNDEYAHRQEPCDFQRMYNIFQAMQQKPDFRDARALYLRFNPHVFKNGGTYFDPPLKVGHEFLLSVLRKLNPEDLKEGLNLIYVHYDTDKEGNLCLFAKADAQENTFGAVLKDCVL